MHDELGYGLMPTRGGEVRHPVARINLMDLLAEGASHFSVEACIGLTAFRWCGYRPDSAHLVHRDEDEQT
ncbi:MAG: hypothetical protein VX836_09840 [Pseudomonadota bacterium]|nr:hypothetical protein [Pseudomonadota bacterium]